MPVREALQSSEQEGFLSDFAQQAHVRSRILGPSRESYFRVIAAMAAECFADTQAKW